MEMNPVEVSVEKDPNKWEMDLSSLPSDCYYRFRKRIEGMPNTLSQKFSSRFLTPSCQGCGSQDHSLLSLSLEGPNYNELRFHYRCPVIRGSPLHIEGYDGIEIFYLLGTVELAEDCGYNYEQARSRNILSGYRTSLSRQGRFETFMERVNDVCTRQNEETEEELRQSNSRILRKRSRELFDQEAGMATVKNTNRRRSTSADSTRDIVSEYRRTRKRRVQKSVGLQPEPQQSKK